MKKTNHKKVAIVERYINIFNKKNFNPILRLRMHLSHTELKVELYTLNKNW